MAAPRVTHFEPLLPGPPDGPALERLQYRIAQSGLNQSGQNQSGQNQSGQNQSGQHPSGENHGTPGGNSQAVPAHARPAVALFPTRTDTLHETPEAAEAPGAAQKAEADGRRAVAELERHLAEEKTAALQAIAAAREQGRNEEKQVFEETLAAERQRFQTQILQSLEEFRIERQRYFHHVEGEVVRLSLAIAARVLHREAHLDPMLLAGAVRVALDKLADSSNVVMRVPPAEVSKWQEFFRTVGNSRIQPGVMEDPSLSPGECLLITELGTIELGVRAQLEEIEKGFFDLLDRRPSSPEPSNAIGPAANRARN